MEILGYRSFYCYGVSKKPFSVFQLSRCYRVLLPQSRITNQGHLGFSKLRLSIGEFFNYGLLTLQCKLLRFINYTFNLNLFSTTTWVWGGVLKCNTSSSPTTHPPLSSCKACKASELHLNHVLHQLSHVHQLTPSLPAPTIFLLYLCLFILFTLTCV